MTRYWLSTPNRVMIATVDEKNIVQHIKSISPEQMFVKDSLDNLLEFLKEYGQVEMMEI